MGRRGGRSAGDEKGGLCGWRTSTPIRRGLPFGGRDGHWKRMDDEVRKRERERKKKKKGDTNVGSYRLYAPYLSRFQSKKKKKREINRYYSFFLLGQVKKIAL